MCIAASAVSLSQAAQESGTDTSRMGAPGHADGTPSLGHSVTRLHGIGACDSSASHERNVLTQRQFANALTGDVEDGIGQCRCRWWRAWLADASDGSTGL